MLKKTSPFIFFLPLVLLLSFPALAATLYSRVIEDLPLMQGMIENADDAVIFDNPQGRILETSAETSSSAEEVKKFYAATLPPLGWKAASPARFVRDEETLTLDLDSAGKMTIVHFTLTPHEGNTP